MPLDNTTDSIETRTKQRDLLSDVLCRILMSHKVILFPIDGAELLMIATEYAEYSETCMKGTVE